MTNLKVSGNTDRSMVTSCGEQDNLTNTQPPLFPSYVQANTDPSQYDVLGRRHYVRLDYRL